MARHRFSCELPEAAFKAEIFSGSFDSPSAAPLLQARSDYKEVKTRARGPEGPLFHYYSGTSRHTQECLCHKGSRSQARAPAVHDLSSKFADQRNHDIPCNPRYDSCVQKHKRLHSFLNGAF